MELSQETLKKIDEVIPKYPEKRSAALMVIHLVQDEIGSISDETCSWIAEKLDLEPINIKELITFYPMLRETPWGKKHIRICRTLPCALRGSYKTCKILEEKLGVKEGHVREDGEFQSNSWNASRIVEKVRLLWLMNKHLKILKERKRKNLHSLSLRKNLIPPNHLPATKTL